MKATTFLQIIMMAGIIGLVYLVVQITQHPDQKVGNFVVPQSTKPTTGTLAATTGTARLATTTGTATGDQGPKGNVFANLDKSHLFDVIMTPPPTPTPPVRTPPTPKPPPDIKAVVKSTGWRLATVWKGKADIEVMGKNEWISLKIGDTREVNFAQQVCILQIVEMNDKEGTMKIKFGEQVEIMKSF